MTGKTVANTKPTRNTATTALALHRPGQGLGSRRRAALRERASRAVNELIVAEVFLVQATIESASVLGDSLRHMREQPEALTDVARTTAPRLLQPYKDRFEALRQVRRSLRSHRQG
ncbi:MAG: hypothetical protein V2J89_03715 [Halieaceae bacterium]|nr:hypothetical protein [Halieaceae bacterium]